MRRPDWGRTNTGDAHPGEDRIGGGSCCWCAGTIRATTYVKRMATGFSWYLARRASSDIGFSTD